ncbi:MAG: hypothetical protein ACYCU7_18310 [Acidimicrobiales bacterium]
MVDSTPLPVRRDLTVVTWRLPVGVSSILLYLVRQLGAYPHRGAAAEDALRRSLAQRQEATGR